MALLVATFLLHLTTSEVLVAHETATMSGLTYSSNTVFTAPRDGTLLGIRLIHKSGTIGCSATATNWGCAGGGIDTYLHRYSSGPLDAIYPVNGGTENIDFPYDGLRYDYRYKFVGDVFTEYSEQLLLLGPTYEVTTSDEFVLIFAESLNNIDRVDNHGTVIVKVLFIYADIEPDTYDCTEEVYAGQSTFDGYSIDSTTFTAPKSGNVIGAKIVHVSGQQTCGPYGLTNWGCGTLGLDTYIYKGSDKFLPIEGSTAHVEWYTGTSYNYRYKWPDQLYDEYSDYFYVYGPTHSVTVGDIFSLQNIEAILNYATHDNTGSVTADVYFIYKNGNNGHCCPCFAKPDYQKYCASTCCGQSVVKTIQGGTTYQYTLDDENRECSYYIDEIEVSSHGPLTDEQYSVCRNIIADLVNGAECEISDSENESNYAGFVGLLNVTGTQNYGLLVLYGIFVTMLIATIMYAIIKFVKCGSKKIGGTKSYELLNKEDVSTATEA